MQRRCLVELVHLHLHFDGDSAQALDGIFDVLQSMLTKSEEHIKETTLVTVGQIAK